MQVSSMSGFSPPLSPPREEGAGDGGDRKQPSFTLAPPGQPGVLHRMLSLRQQYYRKLNVGKAASTVFRTENLNVDSGFFKVPSSGDLTQLIEDSSPPQCNDQILHGFSGEHRTHRTGYTRISSSMDKPDSPVAIPESPANREDGSQLGSRRTSTTSLFRRKRSSEGAARGRG